MGILIAPSMLSADFGKLASEVEMVNNSEADWFHLDIMDGLFVPNISYGFPVVKAIAAGARKPLDAHLMIQDPYRYIDQFADAGVNYLSVHWEACTHLHRTLEHIRAAGMKPGIALNPHTPVNILYDILPQAHFILIMSVNPGFGGQKFIEGSIGKIRKLREIASKIAPDCLIEVDGGVTMQNAPLLAEAGADILVAGNTIFSHPSPAEAIGLLKRMGN